MNALSHIAIAKNLIQDTFRQACASGVFWILLTVTAICTMLCFSVSITGDVSLHDKDETVLFLPPSSPHVVASSIAVVLGGAGPFDTSALAATSHRHWTHIETNPELAGREGVETVAGRMTLAFGAVPFPLFRERADSVYFLELILGVGVAGAFGLLLTLLWTAGFLPTFLEPSSAAVLIAKPIVRWRLLMGKYLGVLIFVGFQVGLFIASTWFALGLRTQVWDTTYWWCVPVLLLQFAVYYSFSVLLAVLTRNTVACVFGSILFWLLAWLINYGALMTVHVSASQSLPPVTRTLAEAAYWISPKPIDSGLMLFNALDADHHFEMPAAFQLLASGRTFSMELSILSSVVITCILLALAAHEFNATDY